MMRWLGLTTLLAVSVATAVEDADGSLANLKPSTRAALIEALDQDLADGPSSRLRNIYSVDGDRVCGLINTRNIKNAYTGYKPFLADTSSATVMIDGEPTRTKSAADVGALIRVACAKQ